MKFFFIINIAFCIFFNLSIFAYERKPINIVAHKRNNIEGVKSAINEGASAIECDIQMEGSGKNIQYYAWHAWEWPDLWPWQSQPQTPPEKMHEFLAYINQQILNKKLNFVFFDFKLPMTASEKEARIYFQAFLAKLKRMKISKCVIGIDEKFISLLEIKANPCKMDVYFDWNKNDLFDLSICPDYAGVGAAAGDPFAPSTQELLAPLERTVEMKKARKGQKSLKVYFWTLQTAHSMRMVLREDVDAIITDDPKLLEKVLGEAEFRSLYRKANANDDI